MLTTSSISTKAPRIETFINIALTWGGEHGDISNSELRTSPFEKSLTEAITRLMSQPELLKKYGAAGRARAQKLFGWNAVAATLFFSLMLPPWHDPIKIIQLVNSKILIVSHHHPDLQPKIDRQIFPN